MAAASSTKSFPSAPWILGLLFVGHVLFAVQRLCTKAVPGRIEEIGDYRLLGPVQFHLGRSEVSARTVETLRQETPENAVIPYRGVDRGPIEQAAALLAPRILYREDVMPKTGLVRGRPPALVALSGTTAVPVVLIATRETLRLEPR